MKKWYYLGIIFLCLILFVASIILKNSFYYNVYQYDGYGNKVAFLYTAYFRPDSWTPKDEYTTSQFANASYKHKFVGPIDLRLEKETGAYSPYLWAGGAFAVIIIIYFIFGRNTKPAEKAEESVKLPQEIIVYIKK